MPKTDPAASASDEPGSRDALDHDNNGAKGGVAPPPETTWLVVLKDHKGHGLSRGEVIGVADADVKPLLANNTARSATDQEVELAQPRTRLWSPAA